MADRDPVELARLYASSDFDRFKRAFDADPFHRQLGIQLVERSEGLGRIRLDMNAQTARGIGGAVHGGVLASMADIAMLVAVFTKVRPGQIPAGTADLGITYLRQAHGPAIFAEARVIKHGRQLSSIEVDITDTAGALCAKGRVLYAFRVGES